MSKPRGVEETLQLLEGLQRAAREVAGHRRRGRDDARRREARERARREAALAEERQALERAVQRVQDEWQERLSQVDVSRQSRAARIRQAGRSARKAGEARLEAEEGRRKFELQREMLRATREREAGLAVSDAARAEREHALADQLVRLTALEGVATQAFSVYGRVFVDGLVAAHEQVPVELGTPDERSSEALREALGQADVALARWRRRILPMVQGLWPLWLVLSLAPAFLVPMLNHFRPGTLTYGQAFSVSGGIVVLLVISYLLGRALLRPLAATIQDAIGRARILHHAAVAHSVEVHRREREAIEEAFTAASTHYSAAWEQVLADLAQGRESLPALIEVKERRAVERLEARHRADLDRLAAERDDAVRRLREGSVERNEARSREASADGASEPTEEREASARRQAEDEALLSSLVEEVGRAGAGPPRPASNPGSDPWTTWAPAEAFGQAVRFGRLDVELEALTGMPAEELDGLVDLPARFALPVSLVYPGEGSLVCETRSTGRDAALDTLNQVILRLLSSAPPGRVLLTIFDPVGLGQSFAGLMHLADEAEHLIRGRIWTQSGQLEERLADLNDQMEKVIQMYLRNEYATIAEYNEQAGNIAEKYHFLVIADFPANVSDLAARRLLSVLTAGARCGVFALLHRDLRQPLPADFAEDQLRRTGVRLRMESGGWQLNGRQLSGVRLHLDSPPEAAVATAFIQQVAAASRDAFRVEVPFAHVAPSEGEMWTVETTHELRVPIGRTGATKLQYLALGQGTRQHALIAGKTGSGKSTLFHVIITNLALWSRPEEVEFYLVDFKKGVEFKCYATHRLPHARVVAVESDREFGLSVLQRVDDELRRRGELFRARGAQDLAGYRRSGASEVLPRILLAVDEFQEFFVEEDRVGQNASVLLDRIVRQGRAFGIHVLLGSQTLGGAYTVARSTLGQMVVRIALQCNEADAYLIMDENNPAPRLLSRPGEGIYNDAAGAREGNSPFQTVWLPDSVREPALRRIRERADREPSPPVGPMVFEGNAPAEVADNADLRAVLEAPAIVETPSARIWLGAPNSIKGPTEVAFEARSGSHLLIVGQHEDAVAALMAVGLVSLAAQHRPGRIRLRVLDGSAPESAHRSFLDKAVARIPGGVRLDRAEGLGVVMEEVAGIVRERTAEGAAPPFQPVFLLVHGIQAFRKLRVDDEFGFGGGDGAADPGAQFRQVIADGAAVGVHVIAACDTYGTVTRYLGRKGLAEFGSRVLFQMSANDSASLIDNPAASRLGLHRALLYEEREGHIEVFRPYAVPGVDWMEKAGRALERLAG